MNLPRLFRLVGALVLLSPWANRSFAGAQAVFTHPVQEGDTFESIAQRYYGDPTRDGVLREANRVRENDPNALVSGSWVYIPTVAFYRVQEGDTWKSIALDLFGREDRFSALVDANGADRREEPSVGTELLVPYPLPHLVAPGDTLSAIAKRYLGDEALELKRLRRFNAGARIERGRIVLVPLLDLRLVGEGGAEAREAFQQAAGDGGAQAIQEEIAGFLPELIQRVRDGQYVEAVALANRILGMRRLTSSQTVTVHKELAVAYVALERLDLAEAAFRTALALQPNLELDSVRTSPRVLEAFNRAKLGDSSDQGAGSTP